MLIIILKKSIFSSHLRIHYFYNCKIFCKFFYKILKLVHSSFLIYSILLEYIFVIFLTNIFNTMNYRESYHLISIIYIVYISYEFYRINKRPQTFEGQCISCIVFGTKGSNLWAERVLYSRGCRSSICKWMRPGFRRMETARLRGNTTQHAIFSRVHSKILTFYGRRRVYIASSSTPSLPLQFTVEFQRFDRLFRESSDEIK